MESVEFQVPSSKKEVTDLRGWEMGRERSKETSDVWLLVWVWVQSGVCVCVCVCVWGCTVVCVCLCSGVNVCVLACGHDAAQSKHVCVCVCVCVFGVCV